MSNNNAESSTNDTIRTLVSWNMHLKSSGNDIERVLSFIKAIFFAATAVGLLSFVEAVFANRGGSTSSKDRVYDDVVVTCLLLSMLFSLSVAALRRPHGNTHVADFILKLSFLTLLTGAMVFTWANQRTIASIVFTVSFVLLVIAYWTWTDPNPNGEEGKYSLSSK